MNEDIRNEILNLIKEDLGLRTAIKRLGNKGVNEEDATAFYNQILKEYEESQGNKKRLIYSSITIATLLVSFFLIPITITGNYPILCSIFLAIIISYLIFLSIMGFPNSEYRNDFLSNAAEKTHSGLLVLIALFPIAIFSLIIGRYYYYEVDHEIEKFGRIVKAEVVDGYSNTTTTTRRFQKTSSTSYTLRVFFTDKKGKEYSVLKDVTSDEYNNASYQPELKVKYSSKHPEFFKLIFDEKRIEKLKSIDRMMQINSLMN